MNTCAECSATLSGQRTKFCSDGCRYRHRDRNRLFGQLTCGEGMWRGPTSAPQGVARCRPCRRASQRKANERGEYEYRTPCIDCPALSYGERCRPCADKANVYGRVRIRPLDDHRVQRRHREESAPGLTRHQRTLLLRKWKSQRRQCAYCPALATTVDHVVPLVRGGTNHEGNLVPACRSCNGRKGGLTLIEWRTGKRLPPMTTDLPWAIVVGTKRKPRQPKPVRMVVQQPCRICQHTLVTAPKAYCSDECRAERNRRVQRDRYRASVGLPVDPDRPTSKWQADAHPALPLTLVA